MSDSCDPMDHSLPGSSVHGTSEARILGWVAISCSRGSSWLRDWTCFLHWQAVHFLILAVQSLSHVPLFATPWTAACQASLSFTISQSLIKLMFIVSVMPSSHLILCHTLLLLTSIFPRIRVFSNESALCIRWPKYWSFSFSISPSNEYSELISSRID